MNLLETLLNSQDGALVRQLANNFQLDEAQTRSAIGALVPALSRGISNNASNPQGLDALVGALANGNHTRYVDQPDELTRPEAVDEGNSILGHVLGSRDVSRAVADQASTSIGLDSSLLRQMLPLIASAVMGSMAKNGFGAATGAGPVASASASAPADSGLGGLLTNFLDADKDGSVVDDLLGMASRFLR